jgi:hypothetical protein
MNKTNESILILFKSVLLPEFLPETDESKVKEYNSITISKGFMLDPRIIINASSDGLKDIIKDVEKNLIIKGSQINNTFHKSWDKVANASDFQLRLEQIVHYMTTYGLESLGHEYDKDNVFIPYERLDIPELKEDIKLMYIKGITKEELKKKVVDMLASGVALKQETIDMLADTFSLFELSEKEISELKNKEIKMILYQKYDMVPSNPTEFVRFLIYEITGHTLIIKSKQVIEEISQLNNKSTARRLTKLFNDYENEYGLEKLATIFFRFKPIFLAMRHIGDN